MPEACRKYTAFAKRETPRNCKPGRRRVHTGSVQIELSIADTEQHARIRAKFTELIHLVVPLPTRIKMYTCWMFRFEHVHGELLCPRMSVESCSHDRAVLGPAVATISRRVDRKHMQRASRDAAMDRRPLRRTPRRFTDRKQRQH